MSGAQYGGGRRSQLDQFNELLKTSDYFADVMNTHRRATAEVVAQFVGVLVQTGALNPAQVLQALHKLENEPGKPSPGSARRLVVGLVRDAINKEQ